MLKRYLALLLGNFSWHRPPWANRTLRRIRSHRLISTTAVLVVLLALNGGAWAWRWYQRQPKPQRVTVSVAPIPVTPLEKELHPAALIVSFDASVAKLEQIGKPVTSGVRLEPAADGAWSWASDSKLVFTPKNDWPADQKYRVTLAKTLFPTHLRFERYYVEVRTPVFAGSIKETQFYQDPRDPAIKQVVVTVEFTHSVERATFEDRVALSLLGGSAVFGDTKGARPFTVDYGLHDRLAYIRSVPLQLPEREDFMRVQIGKGIATSQGGALTRDELQAKVRVPDIASFFKIEASSGQIVRNDDGQPEQVLVIDTTAAARSEDLQKALHVFLLPKKEGEPEAKREDADEENDEEADENETADRASDTQWSSAAEVDDDVLKRAKPVQLTLVPSPHEQTQTHAFKFTVEDEGTLFIRIDKGVQALGGFPLGATYDNVFPVPAFQPEIEIQGRGGILALNGERKLSIKSRGVATIQFDIARISANQINHLVTQTEGRFDQPEFRDGFDEENIARIAVEQQAINLESNFKAHFSAFDFSSYLPTPADGGSERGLFLLRARAWDPVKKTPIRDIADRRFVLVTDIGLLVKKSADGRSDVFLVSLQKGEPLAGVEVQVLGKNGLPLAAGTSTPDGHVSLPSLAQLKHERQPVAFVARLGDDVAFMPFERADRELDFSRFETDGVTDVTAEQLDAFVFTERGIYRPGDEVHIGCVVKQRNWSGRIEGLPLEVEVIDARGVKAQVRKLAVPAMGFAELSFQTANESPTGEYQIHLYLVRDGKRGTLLGETDFHVKEFLPDRMKIETHLSKESVGGWIDPKDVHAEVALRNLYGTPATDRRIVSQMQLAPGGFRFAQFKDYVFHDPLHDEKKTPAPQTIDLGEKTTDADGKATVALELERFADATYEMTLSTQGFEADGGRSVSSYNTVLVSALPRVIGYKADCELNYIPKGSAHAIEFIAVDPALHKVAAGTLRFNLVEQNYVSILARQENGNYAFESALKERPVRSEEISLAPEGFSYALPTETPGSFVLEVLDRENRRVSKLGFTVVGAGNVSRALDKNSELVVKLDRQQYNAGDEIEMSITAPFTGSGLITIESGRVHAHQWFKSETTSSVQRIRVPQGFDGTGYINVSFVRALDSKEIFMSPLSYAVLPFTVNKEKRRLHVDLHAAEIARPGEPLRISYRTDRPAKIAIFAVEEGILQVTDFTTPDPLDYFFRKTALAVQTSQIVDLIIPEFSILRNAAAAGGDADKRLNPFKRVTEKPVVFWSGIIDADQTEREVVYNVPDYFDGTLKIMAVAIAPDAAGSAEKETIVRGPFIISPSVPTVAAPGDRFDVGVTIANHVAGSGENAEINLSLEPSSHLEILQAPAAPLRIAEGREATVTFSVRVKDELGSASLTFRASANGAETTRRATLSVRPATPFLTQVRSGNFTNGSTDVAIDRALYSEHRQLEATISSVPLGLAHGLDFYLQTFPHGCSEQISSAAFSRLLLADEADFGLRREEVRGQLEKVFATLRRRQNDQGAFGYWSAETGDGNEFVSVYATHLLSEAKAAGFAPPADILKNALRHLQTVTAREPDDLAEGRTIAYAIYVLTREGFITTNYILNLTDNLDRKFGKIWSRDLAGVYLAGAWSMLKKEDAARALIADYRIGEHEEETPNDFYQPLGADAQYVAIVARHFPDLLKKIGAREFEAIANPIAQGDFNTLSAAYAVWAVKSYSQHVARQAPELSMAELTAEKRETTLSLGGSLVRRAPFSAEAAALRFTARNAAPGLGAFYQVLAAGFDRQLPTKPITQGLEVYREFLDRSGNVTATARLGESITVRLTLRSLSQREVSNVALLDLLPGGFEMVGGSLQPGVGSAGCDYVDLREDRAIFYRSATPSAQTTSYQIKPTNRGEFVVPPPYAESMYDRGIVGRGMAARITVVDAK
ncbi:MAG TPA: alpha-2-macroglobulin [Chthoniobacterales bacterium]|nr:alpha-2-macroglobulin [Chthoniobacterales bacterium]